MTGLFLWVSLLLPMLSGKSGSNPQSRDLVLQLVERLEILVFPFIYSRFIGCNDKYRICHYSLSCLMEFLPSSFPEAEFCHLQKLVLSY